MDKVNFFILGAPKCGTTSMVDYLGQHPHIYFPKIKEPHFFCTDFDDYRRIEGLSEYHGLYPFVKKQHDIYGDASVWYLYSKKAIEEIVDYNPDAKFLVMLRKPTELVPSLHSQLLYSGRESIASIEKAWHCCVDRKKGVMLPKHVKAKEHLYYDEVCKYSVQLERVFDNVHSDRVKIVFFENFVTNTRNIVKDVFNFLGVDCEYDIKIQVINSNKVHKFYRVSNFLMHPPYPINKIKKYLKKNSLIKKNTPLRGFYEFMSVKKKREMLSESLSEKIINNYRADIVCLEGLLNVDLNNWFV